MCWPIWFFHQAREAQGRNREASLKALAVIWSRSESSRFDILSFYTPNVFPRDMYFSHFSPSPLGLFLYRIPRLHVA